MGAGIWSKVEFNLPLKLGTGEYILPFLCVLHFTENKDLKCS